MKLGMSARVQAFVLLALVATSGALAGVVGDRLLSERTSPAAPAAGLPAGPPPARGPWRWEARPDARYAERLAQSLSLTADQERAIDHIVAEEQVRVRELTREVQPRFRVIAEETRGRIEGVLTAEQRQRLQELREERAGVLRPRDGMRPGVPRNGALRDSIVRERRDRMMRERQQRLRQRADSLRAVRGPNGPG